MERLLRILVGIWNLGAPRFCDVCCVRIRSVQSIKRDWHMCDECHARTRELAKSRRKERRKLDKRYKKEKRCVLKTNTPS